MPELFKSAIETACLAVYAEEPATGTPDQEVEQGLSYIYDGAKVWPGNGVAISDEERDSMLAGQVIERLGAIIVSREDDYYRRQHPKLHNPYLDQAIEVVDRIIPREVFEDDCQQLVATLYEELSGVHYTENPLPNLIRVARTIRSEAPQELPFYFDLLRKSKEIFTSRGTVTQDAFFFDEIEAGADKMDTSLLAPKYIEVDEDGTIHEPSVHSLLSLVEQTGALARPYDSPYYHTWDAHSNSEEILDALLKDIEEIHAAVNA